MRGLRRLLTILFVAVLAGGAVWAIVGRGAPPQPRPGTQIEADAPMPVLAAKASLADVPVYLDGVGAVRALNMVRVHTLVDSTLIALKLHRRFGRWRGVSTASHDPACGDQSAFRLALALASFCRRTQNTPQNRGL